MKKREIYTHLKKQGWSFARIARQYGVTENAVRNAINYTPHSGPRTRVYNGKKV